MKAISRQPPPEDSFCTEYSSIEPNEGYNNQDIFSLNNRAPVEIFDDSTDTDQLKSWVSNTLKTGAPTPLQDHTYVFGDIQEKTSVKAKTKHKVSKVAFNIGEERKANEVSCVSLSVSMHSVVMNHSLPSPDLPPLRVVQLCHSQHQKPSHEKIFSSREGSGVQINIYKLEHECIMAQERLLSINHNSHLLSHEVSVLRRNLIQLSALISGNRSMEFKFKPLLISIENSLLILSSLQRNHIKISELEDITKSIVKDIYSVDNLRKLVKVLSVKRILLEIQDMRMDWDALIKDKRGYLSRCNLVTHFEDRMRENEAEIGEVLSLFNEQQLKRQLKYSREEVRSIVRRLMLGPIGDIQRDVSLSLAEGLV